MGNSCTSAADAVANLVTENEIHNAVRSIEEWQQAQATAVKVGAQSKNTYGPLLQRVGGVDVVKKVVELFYRKLYGDPRLILFLHDQDVVHLRAKQSAFISWLFGPPNMPYMGRSVRIAHLRIIKQRGFNGDDYDLGMRYFEQSMTELGAPEQIVGEVMRRLRPFKDAFFTASPKDAEEEARWAAEEREREEAEAEEERKRREQEEQEAAYHEKERRLAEQITLAHRAAEAEAEAETEAGEAKEWAADAAVAAAVTAALGAASRGVTAPPSRAPTCPFTGGRASRPASAKVQDSSSGAVPAAAATPVATGVTESPPPKPATPPVGGAATGVPTPPRSQSPTKQTARPASAGLVVPPTSTAAAADGTRVPSPAAPQPGTPPVPADRPGSAAVSATPPPTAPTGSDNPPAMEYETELEEIERALAADGGGTAVASEKVPLLSGASVSDMRRTAAVC